MYTDMRMYKIVPVSRSHEQEIHTETVHSRCGCWSNLRVLTEKRAGNKSNQIKAFNTSDSMQVANIL